MRGIRKGYKLKIMGLIISMVFLCNTALYSQPVSLRVPIGDYGRPVEALGAQGHRGDPSLASNLGIDITFVGPEEYASYIRELSRISEEEGEDVLDVEGLLDPEKLASESEGRQPAGYFSLMVHDLEMASLDPEDSNVLALFVAKDAKGKIVGATLLERPEHVEERFGHPSFNAPSGYDVVRLNYRSQGIARELRKEAFQWLIAEGYSRFIASMQEDDEWSLRSLKNACAEMGLHLEPLFLSDEALKGFVPKGLSFYIVHLQTSDFEVKGALLVKLGEAYREDIDHGLQHAEDLIEKARILATRLKRGREVDWKVLVAAILLHDIDVRDQFHAEKNAALAAELLGGLEIFSEDDIRRVQAAIRLHQTRTEEAAIERKEAGLEAQILYDVDQWDAFGVKGIYRHIVTSIRRGTPLEEILPNVQERRKTLTFKETRKLAKYDYRIAESFFKALNNEAGFIAHKFSEIREKQDYPFEPPPAGAMRVAYFIERYLDDPPWVIAQKSIKAIEELEGPEGRRDAGYAFVVDYFRKLQLAYAGTQAQEGRGSDTLASGENVGALRALASNTLVDSARPEAESGQPVWLSIPVEEAVDMYHRDQLPTEQMMDEYMEGQHPYVFRPELTVYYPSIDRGIGLVGYKYEGNNILNRDEYMFLVVDAEDQRIVERLSVDIRGESIKPRHIEVEISHRKAYGRRSIPILLIMLHQQRPIFYRWESASKGPYLDILAERMYRRLSEDPRVNVVEKHNFVVTLSEEGMRLAALVSEGSFKNVTYTRIGSSLLGIGTPITSRTRLRLLPKTEPVKVAYLFKKYGDRDRDKTHLFYRITEERQGIIARIFYVHREDEEVLLREYRLIPEKPKKGSESSDGKWKQIVIPKHYATGARAPITNKTAVIFMPTTPPVKVESLFDIYGDPDRDKTHLFYRITEEKQGIVARISYLDEGGEERLLRTYRFIPEEFDIEGRSFIGKWRLTDLGEIEKERLRRAKEQRLSELKLYLVIREVSKGKDYYWILGVHAMATQDEITRQYLKLSQLYYPDGGSFDADFLELLREAFEILSDPEKREAYDRVMINRTKDELVDRLEGYLERKGNEGVIFDYDASANTRTLKVSEDELAKAIAIDPAEIHWVLLKLNRRLEEQGYNPFYSRPRTAMLKDQSERDDLNSALESVEINKRGI